ncbi:MULTISPECIES: lipopolysaccharide assembly protein LapA domain-containing protein [unclassified Pseudonocardia]|nr:MULTISPECIES: lipopolysaccharide assembly protein LapA domain-containing protein [unclassified Pseudonocardia]
MSEDPTRAMPVEKAPSSERHGPTHGSVGPADPHADPDTQPGLRRPDDFAGSDPVTDPGMRAVPAAPEAPTVPVKQPPVVTRTRTGGLWTGLILSAIVLVFLLVFILQNLAVVTIYFLGFTFSLPIGVALLLAAIAGLLLVAIPGGLRILQLRRVARRAGRVS